VTDDPHQPLAEPPAPGADIELVRRAQTGDQEAFGDLVRTHYETAFRVALSVVRHEHDARDVCQDVWVIVWKKLPLFRGESKFSTWLHPIIVRRSLDHLRKRRRWFDRFVPFRAEGDDPDASSERFTTAAEPVAEETPRDDIEKLEKGARFERALATLPPKHRAVITLREVQGLSYDEIAQAMKIRPGTVMSRLYHARRLLLRKLKDLPCD
jgi:RNA polymerase sigma-70 factor (ECF subfamily)